MDLYAGTGVAVREFPLKPGHGEADHLIYAKGMAIGVVEAKKEGYPLKGVETQSNQYTKGPPYALVGPPNSNAIGFVRLTDLDGDSAYMAEAPVNLDEEVACECS